MKYIKIYRQSETHEVESDRLQRFLEAGWSTENPKKLSITKTASRKKLLPKVEIKAEAEVNHKIPNDDDLQDVEWDIQQLTTEENDHGNTNR